MSLLSAVLAEEERAQRAEGEARAARLRPRLAALAERATALAWPLRESLLARQLLRVPPPHRAPPAGRVGALRHELAELRGEAGVLPGQPELGRALARAERACEQAGALAAAEQAQVSLESARVSFRRGRCGEAVTVLDAAVASLTALEFDKELESAMRNLKRSLNTERALYAAELSSEWEETFSWSERRTLAHVTYSLHVRQSDSAYAHSIISALYAVKRLNAELCRFSTFFIDKIIACIIAQNCEIFTDENVDTIIFNIKFNPSDKKEPSFSSIFNNLIAVFDFIHSTIDTSFEDGATFISVLSASIGSQFFDKLITDCIKKYLPDCSSCFQQYKELTSDLDTFNKRLIEIKFIHRDDSPLVPYMENSDCVLYKKKCEKILSQVRQLLSQSMSHATLKVSKECDNDDTSILNITAGKEIGRDILNKPLFLPQCVISGNVKSIMSLIVDHLNESIKLPPLYSTQLVVCIKDIAVMYQALVPNIYKVNLKSCPLDIALFFNNCFYMAHVLVGPPWRSVLPAELADSLNTTLVECVQDLRVLGMHYLSHYLQQQNNIILEAIQPDERIIWDYDSYERFNTATTDSVSVMRMLKCHWLDVLPTAMYHKAMSTLVTVFSGAILSKIFNTKNEKMDEELVYMLATRIKEDTRVILDLYKEPVDLALTISVWSKFSKISHLLTAQMMEISTMWEKGSGALAQEYSCQEVRHIIKMRFPDDEFRLKILATIQ